MWDEKGVLYYELLKPGETINGERYRTQLICLKRAIAEKHPEYATRHEALMDACLETATETEIQKEYDEADKYKRKFVRTKCDLVQNWIEIEAMR